MFSHHEFDMKQSDTSRTGNIIWGKMKMIQVLLWSRRHSPNSKSAIKPASTNPGQPGIPNAKNCSAALCSKDLAKQKASLAWRSIFCHHSDPKIFILHVLGQAPQELQELKQLLFHGRNLVKAVAPMAPTRSSCQTVQARRTCTMRAKPGLDRKRSWGRSIAKCPHNKEMRKSDSKLNHG